MLAPYHQQNTSPKAVLIVAAVLIAAFVMLVPLLNRTQGRFIHPPTLDKSMEVPLPPLCDHATEGHAEALLIRSWINKNGRYCCFECLDGRSRCACKMPLLGYTIAVYDRLATITAYATTRTQALKIVHNDFCPNPYDMAH